MEKITEYKEYIYTSKVNEKIIVLRGAVYAIDKADAIYQAKKETSRSGYNSKEIKIKFL